MSVKQWLCLLLALFGQGLSACGTTQPHEIRYVPTAYNVKTSDSLKSALLYLGVFEHVSGREPTRVYGNFTITQNVNEFVSSGLAEELTQRGATLGSGRVEIRGSIVEIERTKGEDVFIGTESTMTSSNLSSSGTEWMSGSSRTSTNPLPGMSATNSSTDKTLVRVVIDYELFDAKSSESILKLRTQGTERENGRFLVAFVHAVGWAHIAFLDSDKLAAALSSTRELLTQSFERIKPSIPGEVAVSSGTEPQPNTTTTATAETSTGSEVAAPPSDSRLQLLADALQERKLTGAQFRAAKREIESGEISPLLQEYLDGALDSETFGQLYRPQPLESEGEGESPSEVETEIHEETTADPAADAS